MSQLKAFLIFTLFITLCHSRPRPKENESVSILYADNSAVVRRKVLSVLTAILDMGIISFFLRIRKEPEKGLEMAAPESKIEKIPKAV